MEPEEKGLTEEERAQIKALHVIDELVIVQNNHYMLGKYDDAIKIAEEIIEHAKNNNLMELVQEQETYIRQMHAAKEKTKRLTALKELSEMKRMKVFELLNAGEDVKAHQIVEDFKREFGSEFDLNKITPARIFISKESENWVHFVKKQGSLKEELNLLEKLILKAKEQDDMKAFTIIMDQARPLVLDLAIEEITEKWNVFDKEYLEFMNLMNEQIAFNEKKFLENKENKKLDTALTCCENIIERAQKSGNEELITKYTRVIQDLKDQIEIQENNRKKQLDMLQERAELLKGILNIDENTLPLVEEFSIHDHLGDLSGDINETLDKIGSLLNDHRVEIKKEISSKTVLRSISGEMLELEKNIHVEEDNDEPTNYSVQSGFKNPFNELIEESILTDLIPYNFEIKQVRYNRKPVPELPDKKLTKDGLELNWKLENIPSREKVEVSYDLRRRVSRTIIFMLKDQLKIIKMHSNLHSLDIDGSFDVKIPFTNSFGFLLEGVVVEDVIPLYYLHFVKEPARLLHAPINNTNMGDLIKWNIGTMKSETLNYHYRLLEIYKIEEIKINIEEWDAKGAEAIKQGRINDAINNFMRIKNLISNYIS